MYKSSSILKLGIIILLQIQIATPVPLQVPINSSFPTQSPFGSSLPALPTTFKGWLSAIKLWICGPDGSIEVRRGSKPAPLFGLFGGGSGTKMLTINMEPQWTVWSFGFPWNGMQGVMVAADPPDACANLTVPPHHFDFNVSLVDEGLKKWFVIAEDGQCDYDKKILNAEHAGYDILIIRQGPASFDAFGNPVNSTIINSTVAANVTIHTCTISDEDGYHLQKFSFPTATDKTALVQDFRKSQWPQILLKLLLLGFGTFVVATGTGILVNQVRKVLKKKKQEKEKAAIEKVENACKQIADNVPSEKWVTDKEVKRPRCKWCQRKFEPDDDVTTLQCLHMFHKNCLVPRILRGHGYCPVCQEQIHSPPSPEIPPVLSATLAETPLTTIPSPDVPPEPSTTAPQSAIPTPDQPLTLRSPDRQPTTPSPRQSTRPSPTAPVSPVVTKSVEPTETTPLLPSRRSAASKSPSPVPTSPVKKKFHCPICEILGLPLQDELDLVDELARQIGTIHSPTYEYRIPSRHSSLAGSSAASVSMSMDDLADEALADAEVRKITGPANLGADLLAKKLRELVESRSYEDDDEI